jgi:hypothetical protein
MIDDKFQLKGFSSLLFMAMKISIQIMLMSPLFMQLQHLLSILPSRAWKDSKANMKGISIADGGIPLYGCGESNCIYGGFWING